MPGLCGMHRYRHQKKRTPFYLYFGNNIQVHTQPTYPGITRVNPSFCILHLYRWYNMNVKVLIQSLVPCVLSPHVSAAVPLLLWTDEQSPSPWYVVLPIYILRSIYTCLCKVQFSSCEVRTISSFTYRYSGIWYHDSHINPSLQQGSPWSHRVGMYVAGIDWTHVCSNHDLAEQSVILPVASNFNYARIYDYLPVSVLSGYFFFLFFLFLVFFFLFFDLGLSYLY